VSAAVAICEMAPRDGLQMLNREGNVPRARRVELAATLLRAGFPYVELGSFVHPRFVAMADFPELLAELDVPDGYAGELAALVPNEKGYERFREAPHLTTVALFVAASEHYAEKNTGMSVEQAMAQAEKVAAAARADGKRLRAHLSAAFRDLTPENRPTDAARVAELTGRLLATGCSCVALADTDGRATRADLERVLGAMGPLDRIGLHLHDRHGLAIRNAWEAYRLGVRTFDAAVGGIGGNKLLGRAPGNVATEELLEMFHQEDIATGIDRAVVAEALGLVASMARAAGEPDPPSRHTPPREAKESQNG
jgi:hydroxymethylglutaryl-CoA lyase